MERLDHRGVVIERQDAFFIVGDHRFESEVDARDFIDELADLSQQASLPEPVPPRSTVTPAAVAATSAATASAAAPATELEEQPPSKPKTYAES